MKVYFVNSDKNGCYNVRCLFPLQENGWDGDRTTMSLSRATPENKAKALVETDVAVFHRPETDEMLTVMRSLKKATSVRLCSTTTTPTRTTEASSSTST